MLLVQKDVSLRLSDAEKGRGRRAQIRYTHQLVQGTRVGTTLLNTVLRQLPFGPPSFLHAWPYWKAAAQQQGCFLQSCTVDKGSNSPVVRISQPCSPVKPSLITSALPFLPAPVSQIVPARLFPGCAPCCQLVSAQPGGEASRKCLASEQRQPLP